MSLVRPLGMEVFSGLGQIFDDTLILTSTHIAASFSQERSRFLPHHPSMPGSNALYDVYGDVRFLQQTLQPRRTLQRPRQIPPRLRSVHWGERRAAANFNSSNIAATIHQEEMPIASSGSGLSEEFIYEKLKMNVGCSRSDEETCGICLEAIQVNYEELTSLCCGHVYHMGCIKTWLMVKNECALCRASAIPVN